MFLVVLVKPKFLDLGLYKAEFSGFRLAELMTKKLLNKIRLLYYILVKGDEY